MLNASNFSGQLISCLGIHYWIGKGGFECRLWIEYHKLYMIDIPVGFIGCYVRTIDFNESLLV